MKVLFIPLISKKRLNKEKLKDILKSLPKNVAIAYSIQFKELAYEIKQALCKDYKITKIVQTLGCSKQKFPKNTEAVLLIGSGRFHALSLALESKLPVFIFENNQIEPILDQDVRNLESRKRAAYLNFLNAEEIGILVCAKPGQLNLKKAFEFKKHLKSKKSYIFLGNDINSAEFENFGLKCLVNTACPRLDLESPLVININSLD